MGVTYKVAIQCLVHVFGVKQLQLKILSQKWVAICTYMYVKLALAPCLKNISKHPLYNYLLVKYIVKAMQI